MPLKSYYFITKFLILICQFVCLSKKIFIFKLNVNTVKCSKFFVQNFLKIQFVVGVIQSLRNKRITLGFSIDYVPALIPCLSSCHRLQPYSFPGRCTIHSNFSKPLHILGHQNTFSSPCIPGKLLFIMLQISVQLVPSLKYLSSTSLSSCVPKCSKYNI